jgi:hypothetical protein
VTDPREKTPEQIQQEEAAKQQEEATQEETQQEATKDDAESGKLKASATKPAKSYSQREFTIELKKQTAALEQQIRDKVLADLDLEKAKASGELAKVIDAQTKRIKDLEPLEVEVQQFRSLAESRYQTVFESLPDSIKLFAPADDEPIVVKERWLVEKALPAAAALGEAEPKRGLSKSSDPKEKSKTHDDLIKDIRNGYSLTGEYRPM